MIRKKNLLGEGPSSIAVRCGDRVVVRGGNGLLRDTVVSEDAIVCLAEGTEEVRIYSVFKETGRITVKVQEKPHQGAATRERSTAPPRLGELVVCLFVPLEKQLDRLGDFEEKFETLWQPKFGRLANTIYLAHALRSAGSVVRIGVTSALLDRILGAFHWLSGS